MRKLAAHSLAFACLLVVTSALSHASVTEVQYTFFAQLGGNNTASARFLTPTFVATDTTIPASQLEFCQFTGTSCASVILEPGLFVQPFGVVDVFTVTASNSTLVAYAFPNGSFGAFGTYFATSGTALLSVQSVTVTPAPEPSSLLLLSSGTLALAGVLRRKRMR